MAVNAANIMVQVGADTTSLKRGLKDTGGDLKKFGSDASKNLRDVTANIAKMGVAAAAVAAGGLLAMTKSATAAGRELKIFTQISNTSAEEFQNLAKGAAQFGIDADKLADQLKDVNDKVGDFLTTGAGGMTDFFEQIAPKVGVTAQQFKNLSGAQALQLYVKTLEDANVSQTEMTFHLEALASDLTQLQPLLANNGALLKESAERTKQMGLALSDVDILQLEEGAKAFESLAQSSEATASVIGVRLSPFLVEAVTQFENLMMAGGDFGENVDEGIKKVIRSIGFMADMVQGLRVVFGGVKLVAQGFGAAVISTVEGAAFVIRSMIDTIIFDANLAISALNEIPGVDIGAIDYLSNSPMMDGLHALGDAARNNLSTTRAELNALALQELPSDKVEAFLTAVGEKSIETAEKVAAVKNVIASVSVGGDEDQAKKDDEELAIKLEKYENFMKMQLGITERYNGAIGKLTQAQWGDAASQTAGAMKSILGTISTNSRKAFEIKKAWAIGDTLISTYKGIAAGVELGWPMAIPAVAWAAATGLLNLTILKINRLAVQAVRRLLAAVRLVQLLIL